MQYASSLRIVGILLVVFSLLHLPPMAVSLWYNDHEFAAFGQALCLTMATGVSLWLLFNNQRRELRARDGFFVVTLVWVVLCLFGTLPFVLSSQVDINFVDGFFETVSGLTTTGATVLVGLDDYPKSILYYRAQLQLVGGMGIIILAVAILPILGIGGLQLFRAEVTGPIKDNKLTPRIKETAKALWIVYIGLNLACIISYWWAGMSLFDAICFGFSTISTGGYAPYDASMGHYPQPRFLLIASFFMILGGINFALHFMALRNLNVKAYWQDAEARTFILVFIALVIFCWLVLSLLQTDFSVYDNFFRSLFAVACIITTTGFAIENLSYWPTFLAIIVLFAGVIGACSGSTSGGVKIIRAMLMVQQGSRELQKSIHPSGVFPLKINKKVISPAVADAVWGFIAIYIIIFFLIFCALLATNLDMASALSGTMSSLANIGPGLNMLGDNFAQADDAAKSIMSFAMLIGRLEIFTVVILFTPAFWRR
ncbi:MAG: TrkH family potassium uptake protein [Gammaproteobacteria bacterium]